MATYNAANGAFFKGDTTVNRVIIIADSSGAIADTHGANQAHADGNNYPTLKEVVLVSTQNGTIIDTFH